MDDEARTQSKIEVAYCTALNLRSEPSMDAAVLSLLPAGTMIELPDKVQFVSDGKNTWFPVSVDGADGYVCSQFLRLVDE